jgi:hypothetical protein
MTYGFSVEMTSRYAAGQERLFLASGSDIHEEGVNDVLI